jgi:hypothetical protein
MQFAHDLTMDGDRKIFGNMPIMVGVFEPDIHFLSILVLQFTGLADQMPLFIHDTDVLDGMRPANFNKNFGERGVIVLRQRSGNCRVQEGKDGFHPDTNLLLEILLGDAVGVVDDQGQNGTLDEYRTEYQFGAKGKLHHDIWSPGIDYFNLDSVVAK